MGLANGTDPLSVSMGTGRGGRALKWREHTTQTKLAGKHWGQVPDKGRENDIASEDKHGVLSSRFEKAFSYIIEENEVKYQTLP